MAEEKKTKTKVKKVKDKYARDGFVRAVRPVKKEK